MTDRADVFVKGLPIVEGAALRLRAFRAGDRDDVFALYADRDAMRYGFQPKMDSLADADALIERTAELVTLRTVFHWGVADLGGDRIVGHATLFHLDLVHGRAELGYSIAPESRRRGLGRAAAGLLIEFAFGALDLHRIEADVEPRNPASLRLLESLGFVREGHLRERWLFDGERQDAVLLGLLRSEWVARRA